jgi:hypothetical protein
VLIEAQRALPPVAMERSRIQREPLTMIISIRHLVG